MILAAVSSIAAMAADLTAQLPGGLLPAAVVVVAVGTLAAGFGLARIAAVRAILTALVAGVAPRPRPLSRPRIPSHPSRQVDAVFLSGPRAPGAWA
ncbi:hypothetical protein [Gordonia sp. (in: high G+C Gram-positive bacteria)]|uniref:hypothetical protein n=1 Tax=Gordonia sp. (in: high G+C Gram-positive bacteria) TaxID=84139 RepID=UPI0033429AB8